MSTQELQKIIASMFDQNASVIEIMLKQQEQLTALMNHVVRGWILSLLWVVKGESASYAMPANAPDMLGLIADFKWGTRVHKIF